MEPSVLVLSKGDVMLKINELNSLVNTSSSVQKLEKKVRNIDNEIGCLESEISTLEDKSQKLSEQIKYLEDNEIDKMDKDQRRLIKAELKELEDYLKVINHPKQKRLLEEE